MSELTIDSKYLEAEALFRPTAKPNLLVYVEDENDEPFWSMLFSYCVASHYNQIDVKTLRQASRHCFITEVDSKGKTLCARGKSALMKIENLGRTKVVAVDRDYDGIIQNYRPYSSRLETDKWVIPTTYYAIENHLLSVAAMDSYSRQLTGKSFAGNFALILAAVNDILDPILLYLLAIESLCARHAGTMLHPYSISQLRIELDDLEYTGSQWEKECARVKTIINSAHAADFQAHEEEMMAMKSILSQKGKYPDEMWKLLQGHTLFDCVWKVLKYYVQQEYDSRWQQIFSNPDTSRRQQEIDTLKFAMFGSKREDVKGAVESVMYKYPYIDYSDTGIIKIMDRIKQIVK